jgi:hypothetical protein
MSNVNKHNSRNIIGGTKELQMVYLIVPHIYDYSPIDFSNVRANIGIFVETHTN